MEEILKYFPDLTTEQIAQFEKLDPLYRYWNEKINVISRKDIDNLYQHHILHSLAIAKFLTPCAGTTFMDLGTGGGFPGIPLAIIFPDCTFHMIDRIAKKIKVAQDIASEINLTNVTFQHGDVGECHTKFDYVVSRAVMQLPQLINLSRKNISRKNSNVLPSGLLCLKGGDLDNEIKGAGRHALQIPLSDYFTEPFFSTKELIYVEL